ncbi:hypothetical protein BH10PSE9_BH10PSE9_06560 [soil metagenome]
MDRRRLTGLVALIALLALVGVLTWYDATVYRTDTDVAFAPAKSADESAPAPETPIVPPAALTANQPAAAPLAEPAKPAADGAGVAPAEPKPPVVEPPQTAANSPAVEPPPAQPPVAAATAEPPAAKPPADAGVAAVLPTFDIVRVDPSGEAVIAGLAEPSAKVEVLDGANAIATAEANERGEWALALDNALPPGTHDLSVRTTSKNRSIAVLSDQRVAVQIPEAGSKDVLVVLNAPDAASKVLQVPPTAAEPQPPANQTASVEPPKQPEPPAGAEARIAAEAPVKTEPEVKAEPPIASEPRIAAIPPPAEPAPPPAPVVPPSPQPAVTVAAVEADSAGELYIAGTAVTGEAVRVYFQDDMIGEAMPSPSGTWLLQIHREVAPGTYRIRADQIGGADGKVVARAEVPFEREINVAALKATGNAGAAGDTGISAKLPEVETVIIKRGDNLWRVARTAWGKGIRWSNIYQANRDQIRNPRRIYPGQVFMMPKLPGTAKN